MSIYPLDRNKRYQTPGGVILEWCQERPFWSEDKGLGEFTEDAVARYFGQSLTEVVEMTEATVEFDRKATRPGGNMSLEWTNHHGLPLLQPGTTAHFTLTMRYPMGSELNSAKDDK